MLVGGGWAFPCSSPGPEGAQSLGHPLSAESPAPSSGDPSFSGETVLTHMKTCSREHGGELGQSRRVSQRQWPLKYVKI